MLLELGRMSEETASLESNDIVKQYKEVKDVHGKWEDVHFYLGRYYDKLMKNPVDMDVTAKRGLVCVRRSLTNIMCLFLVLAGNHRFSCWYLGIF